MKLIHRAQQIIKRRPVPTNLEALRSCRVSYSQFAEDLILTQLLGYETTTGVYLDIGCYEPIKWSNTYIFYQRGWSGLCIDANPTLRSSWLKRRSRDRFIGAAVGDDSKKFAYVMFDSRSSCNRLVEEDCLEQFLQSQQPDKVESVRCVNIVKLMEEGNIDAGNIDLVSVDVEGMDEAIIKMLDWTVLRPKAVVLEEDHIGSGGSCWLLNRGYDIFARTGLSTILARQD
jgi:FkbM family methyltransferase